MTPVQEKLLSVSLCFLLAACGGGGGNDDDSTGTNDGGVPTSSGGDSSGGSGSGNGSSDPDTSNGGSGSGGTPSTPSTPGGSNETPSNPAGPSIATQWAVSEIPAIAAGRPGTIHFDINDSGTILGTYWNSVNSGARITYGVGTISAGGAITDLGTLDWESAYAEAINNSNQFVGYRANNTGAMEVADRGRYRAFLYSGGAATELPMPATMGVDPETIANHAMNLNNAGEVVGYSTFAAGSASARDQAFLFSNGTRTEIAAPAGGVANRALAINDSSRVVGEADYSGGVTRAFSYRAGTATDLGTLSGYSSSSAVDINTNGQIVGTAFDKSDFFRQNLQPFMYAAGAMRAIPLPDTNSWGEAVAINDLGQVVGTLYAKEADVSRTGAFLHSGGRTINLNTLPEVQAAGITILGVESINARGQIVVYTGMNPAPKHYLLSPVQ